MKTKVYFSKTCPTCGKGPHSPFRVFDARGKVISGCIDEFHTGHLVTPSESASWHGRTAAKKLRAEMKKMRQGGVTEYSRDAKENPKIRRAVRKRRKKNPPQYFYIHIQKHGRGPIMLYNGRSFSSPQNAKPEPFSTAAAAKYKARHLLGKYHRQLSAYKIWISDRFHGEATPATRVNPSPRNLDAAAQKLEDFTGFEATHVERAPARSKDKTGLVIGELDEIGYRAAREGIEGGRLTRYRHSFKKGSRPLLAVSTDGKQLHVVGGQYEFTDAGIEDR